MVRDHDYPRFNLLIGKFADQLIEERSLTYWKKVIEREDNSRDVVDQLRVTSYQLWVYP